MEVRECGRNEFSPLKVQLKRIGHSRRTDPSTRALRVRILALLVTVSWLVSSLESAADSPPVITLQPTNVSIVLNSNATFTVQATGSPPITYQWQFNSTNIPGATDTSLVLTNVQPAYQGNYAAVLSNAFGAALSSNAVLTVVDLTDLAQVLGATNLTFTNVGSTPWFGETTVTHDGVAAVQSSAVNDPQTSTLQTTVTGPGTLSFWWQISAPVFNSVEFQFGGITQVAIFGNTSWTQQVIYLGDGVQTLQWNYFINSFPMSPDYAGWVAQITFTPGTTSPSVVVNPTVQTTLAGGNVRFSATAGGTPPFNYQWQFNGTNITGATNISLSVTDVEPINAGNYSLLVSNASGTATSSNALLTVEPAGPTIASQPQSQAMASGGYVVLSVKAIGSERFSYQWQFNGTNIFEATNSQLVVAGVQANNAGNYVVLVSNAFGATLSTNAVLALADFVVVAWSGNDYDPGNVPQGLTNIVAIAASQFDSHCLALENDGTLLEWGEDSPGDTVAPTGLGHVLSFAAGSASSVAVESGGVVVAWGEDDRGPIALPADWTNVVAVAVGDLANLALRSDGTVVGSGDGIFGQTSVPLGLTDVVAIAETAYESLAFKSDGTVVGWGSMGGLTNIPPGLTNVVTAAAGTYHCMALGSDGKVSVWGDNTYGQMNVPAELSNVVAIAVGRVFVPGPQERRNRCYLGPGR